MNFIYIKTLAPVGDARCKLHQPETSGVDHSTTVEYTSSVDQYPPKTRGVELAMQVNRFCNFNLDCNAIQSK